MPITVLRQKLAMAPVASLLILGPFADALAFEWQTAAPESQGLSAPALRAIQDTMAAKNTRALLIARHDRIVLEWYAPGQSAAMRQGTASLAKALVGGLSLAVAMNDDWIQLDDRVAKLVPQWQGDPRKAGMTIRQLGSHTSGLDDAEQDGIAHDRLTGWKGDFWKRPAPPRDPFTLARDQAPVIFAPGETLHYSNPGIAMLTVQSVPAEPGKPGTPPVDARFEGGLAIYESPAPWGPWSTAFFTERWDVSPGESMSFPTKWMAADGRTVHLVFSGDDSFSVRRAVLRPPLRRAK